MYQGTASASWTRRMTNGVSSKGMRWTLVLHTPTHHTGVTNTMPGITGWLSHSETISEKAVRLLTEPVKTGRILEVTIYHTNMRG